MRQFLDQCGTTQHLLGNVLIGAMLESVMNATGMRVSDEIGSTSTS